MLNVKDISMSMMVSVTQMKYMTKDLPKSLKYLLAKQF